MDLFLLPPAAVVLDAAYRTFMHLAVLLTPLTGSSAAAVAVVLVTIAVRAALIPAGIAQARAEQTRARLAPKLRDIQRRHRGDRERIQRETMALYRSEHASPFAGCLSAAMQAPIVGVIYALFLHTVIAGHPNALLSEQLAGVPLGSGLADALAQGTADWPILVVFGGVGVVIALVAEVSRRVLRPAPVAGDSPAVGSVMVTRLAEIVPFTTVIVAMFVPLAAALYLVTTVTWTFAQRCVLRRCYPTAVPGAST